MDIHNLFKRANKKASVNMSGMTCGDVELAKDVKALRKLPVTEWLSSAAEHYNISSDLRDYIVVPVIICPTDIPNRNSVAFPYEELIGFNPSEGRPAYETWRGKPTFLEHANFDYTKAKGIVFDSYVKPIKGTLDPIAKTICLCGFDFKADPQLAAAIRDKRRTNYSMGAKVAVYECSICGAKTGPASRETACGHVIRGKLPLYDTRFGRKPAYYLARGITGFEVSSVGVPAWVSANEDEQLFSLI